MARSCCRGETINWCGVDEEEGGLKGRGRIVRGLLAQHRLLTFALILPYAAKDSVYSSNVCCLLSCRWVMIIYQGSS